MATELNNNMNENETSLSNGADKLKTFIESSDDKTKASTARHPRWTRQETFVLIQGKRVAEDRIQKGRRCSSSAFGADRIEPKWDFVSSYCKRHGVNRGPVQCRKRWSNLLGDFKKVKTWDSEIKEEAESYWVMRNDLRRERKLPGFFDRGVFDVLDGRELNAVVCPLALVAVTEDAKEGNGMEAVAVEEEEEDDEEELEAVFDSSRHAAAEDGIFSDFEQSAQEETEGSPEKETFVRKSPRKTVITPLPISEKQYQPFCQGYSYQDTTEGKQPSPNSWRGTIPQEGWKRRRLSSDGCEDTNMEEQLIKILDRNSNMLNAQFDAQNLNCQLDRDQQKDHTNSLVAALGKLTDAIVRIADKL